ncbi:hypothetical protein P8C59_001691 [Phyllachora maydis]|uniref:Integrase catalytic domain-containing protein n=1 Tax=Phyllachora maydis TaxID=1825666 RepID=A0AAD9I063_9PEZI|nr:hypothetical protein P8C59_001691 [Phyllachora maydis]
MISNLLITTSTANTATIIAITATTARFFLDVKGSSKPILHANFAFPLSLSSYTTKSIEPQRNKIVVEIPSNSIRKEDYRPIIEDAIVSEAIEPNKRYKLRNSPAKGTTLEGIGPSLRGKRPCRPVEPLATAQAPYQSPRKTREPEPLTGTRDLPHVLREPVIEGNKVEKAISSPTLKEPNIGQRDYYNLLNLAKLWHVRLGHIGLRLLKKTSSITKGLPNFDKIKEADFHYSSYDRGKAVRRVSKALIPDPPRVLDSIEGDTVKIRPRPYSRNPIVLLLVNRKSRYRWVFNLPNKSGPIVANAIKGFFRGLRNGFGRYPTEFHFNGGTEITDLLATWLAKRGIKFSTSTPYIYEQNGLVERSVRVILDLDLDLDIEGAVSPDPSNLNTEKPISIEIGPSKLEPYESSSDSELNEPSPDEPVNPVIVESTRPTISIRKPKLPEAFPQTIEPIFVPKPIEVIAPNQPITNEPLNNSDLISEGDKMQLDYYKLLAKISSYILSFVYKARKRVISKDSTPTTYKQVLKLPRDKRSKWLEAITKEFIQLLELGVFKFLPRSLLPFNRKLITYRNVLKVKKDAENRPIKYKSRLVARGFIQVEGLDYTVTYASTRVFYNAKTCHFIVTYIDDCLFKGPNIGYITDLKKRLNKWLSRSLNRPTKSHLNAAKNLFKYLNSTKDYSICLSYNGNTVADLGPKLSNSSNTTTKLSRDFHSKEGPRPLTTTSTTIVDSRNSKGSSRTSIINSSLVPIGFSDSDFTGDKATSKSTYGYLYKLAGRPISWKTKRATTIALSTLEAETNGLTEAIREVQWIIGLFSKLHRPIDHPITLYGDNQGSITVANNPALYARTKYTLLKFQYVREQVKAKIVTIIYLNTKYIPANGLTKALPGKPHDFSSSVEDSVSTIKNISSTLASLTNSSNTAAATTGKTSYSPRFDPFSGTMDLDSPLRPPKKEPYLGPAIDNTATSNLNPPIDIGSKEGFKDTITSSIVKELSKKAYTIPEITILLMLLRNSLSSGPKAAISRPIESKKEDVHNEFHALIFSTYKKGLSAFNTEFNSYLAKLTIAKIDIDPSLILNYLNIEYLMADILEESRNPAIEAYRAAYIANSSYSTPNSNSNPSKKGKNKKKGKKKASYNIKGQNYSAKSAEQASFMLGSYNLAMKEEGESDSNSDSSSSSDCNTQLAQLLALKGYKKRKDFEGKGLKAYSNKAKYKDNKPRRRPRDPALYNSWLYDTGSTDHISNSKERIGSITLEVLSRKAPPTYTKLVLDNVLYLPDIDINIAPYQSPRKTREPKPLNGTRDLPYLLREPVIKGNKVVEKAISSPTLKEPNIGQRDYYNLLNLAKLWHVRLGHIGLRLLKKTSSITKGLPNFNKIKEADFHCSSCDRGKAVRRVSKALIPDLPRVLDSIEGDTVKIRPRPYNRNPIVLLLVNRKSRYRWVFNLPNKSGPIVANAFKGFFRGLRNGFGRYPTKFHFNRGTEITDLLTTWLAKRGIKFSTSAPYIYKQNGLVERSVRVILDLELVNSIAISNKETTPFQALFDELEPGILYIPNLERYQAIGARGEAIIPLEKRSKSLKFTSRTEECKLLLVLGSKTYLVYILSRRAVLKTSIVKFIEDNIVLSQPINNTALEGELVDLDLDLEGAVNLDPSNLNTEKPISIEIGPSKLEPYESSSNSELDKPLPDKPINPVIVESTRPTISIRKPELPEAFL